MFSLSDRISLLEGMLLEKGVQPPPAVHPPKTRHGVQKSPAGNQKQNEPKTKPILVFKVPSPPDSANEGYTPQDSDRTDSVSTTSPGLQPLANEQFKPKQEDTARRLPWTKENLSFEQLSRRSRCFGPTANSHVYYTESTDQLDSREQYEQIRRVEHIIRTLTVATHDYLMQNFWTHYNNVLEVIHKESFEADRGSQSPEFYSPFLHVAILAMGFRFADVSRDDMISISLGNRESILHREARCMLDVELDRPGGISSIQALLLLGDLECGVGRDNTGWMYAGKSIPYPIPALFSHFDQRYGQ